MTIRAARIVPPHGAAGRAKDAAKRSGQAPARFSVPRDRSSRTEFAAGPRRQRL